MNDLEVSGCLGVLILSLDREIQGRETPWKILSILRMSEWKNSSSVLKSRFNYYRSQVTEYKVE